MCISLICLTKSADLIAFIKQKLQPRSPRKRKVSTLPILARSACHSLTPLRYRCSGAAAAKKDNTPIDIDEDKPNLEEEDSEGEEEDEAENARRQEETETLMVCVFISPTHQVEGKRGVDRLIWVVV